AVGARAGTAGAAARGLREGGRGGARGGGKRLVLVVRRRRHHRERAGVRRALPPQRGASLPTHRYDASGTPGPPNHRAVQGQVAGGGDLPAAAPPHPPADRRVLAQLLRVEWGGLLPARERRRQLDVPGRRSVLAALVWLLGRRPVRAAGPQTRSGHLG